MDVHRKPLNDCIFTLETAGDTSPHHLLAWQLWQLTASLNGGASIHFGEDKRTIKYGWESLRTVVSGERLESTVLLFMLCKAQNFESSLSEQSAQSPSPLIELLPSKVWLLLSWSDLQCLPGGHPCLIEPTHIPLWEVGVHQVDDAALPPPPPQGYIKV